MLSIAIFLHTLRSDWNNGNAHFLRGLARELGSLGHTVRVLEPVTNWSVENLRTEPNGEASLAQFATTYPDIDLRLYDPTDPDLRNELMRELHGFDAVIVHEWNERGLIDLLLDLRSELGFRALFHDTHHRASSSPEAIRSLRVDEFDGVLAFGDALTKIYKERFGITECWTLHEAADTTVFYPREAPTEQELIWVGNWGDGERSAELREFLIRPARRLREQYGPEGFRATIYGVRYPADGLAALADAGIRYGGYLPNLAAPDVYARSRVTMHVPRQQYNDALTGIPTIRVFEALASGIPLVSAPWQDTEELFRPGDFTLVSNGEDAYEELNLLLDPEERDNAQAQIEQGLATVLARHTCAHRAAQLTRILTEEVLG
ncbi:CgeB family protein [Terriglobus aquaticus]|uniref:Glycosyltransferase n=1 Tax=Terriglobus aquaticus TaxID=940139 RepID=A0ABW9KN72_9BACT|nr:glycosyltransferase [Terriglobus aquaticus]